MNTRSQSSLAKVATTPQTVISSTPPEKRAGNKRKATTRRVQRKQEKVSAPEGWLEEYSIIRELRKEKDAPVDIMGCENSVKRASPPKKTYEFQVVVNLMLSAQTRDEMTAKAFENLLNHGLTLENILATPDNKLNSLIKMVGFHNKKTKYIKQMAAMVKEKHNSQVPDTLEQLISLPGVGVKMGNIILRVAFGKIEGVGVDTHVHRVCNQLEWVSTKLPDQTETALQQWLPKEHWEDMNLILVGFGQLIQTQPHLLVSKALRCSDPILALRVLRKVKVKIDAKDKKSGETALVKACKDENADAVKLLVENGASTKVKLDGTVVAENDSFQPAVLKALRGVKMKEEEETEEEEKVQETEQQERQDKPTDKLVPKVKLEEDEAAEEETSQEDQALLDKAKQEQADFEMARMLSRRDTLPRSKRRRM